MAYTDGESLEQTQARLGLASGDVLATPETALLTTPEPSRPSSNKRRLVILAVVIVTLVAAGAIFGGLTAYRSGLANGTIVDEWTTYPGVFSSHPRAILAAPSKETTVASLDAFTEEFKAALASEYSAPVDWTIAWDGNDRLEPNGYGGDSMLYSYFGPNWVGATTINDPDARRRIIEIFQQLSAAHGGDDFYIANDIYADDSAESKKQFGAAAPGDQADWRAHNSNGNGSVVLTIEVVDATVPMDSTFASDYWFTDSETGKRLPGNFYISIQLWADDLLAEADRSRFAERARDYDEANKPDARS